MIFADKLILLRKKVGWSQEELADQMNVTRQSVSKWEGAQSVPDLEKMLRLSELFGVSTDYLLKDEIEEAEHIDSSDDTPSLRRVSMEEANAFLSVKLRTAKTIAYAAFLCILSPIALLILSAISESTAGVLNENIANGIGMIVLIILVAIAAVMFISSGSKTAPFAYLEKEKFETEYGVSGMVKERKAQYKDLHTKNNIAGTCLCIAALISFLCHRYSYAYCRRGLCTFAAFYLSCISLIQDKPVSGVGCRSPPANLSFQKIQIGGNSMAYNKRLREYLGTLDRRFICCADKALAISIGLAKKD